jgi:hypothetical protein
MAEKKTAKVRIQDRTSDDVIDEYFDLYDRDVPEDSIDEEDSTEMNEEIYLVFEGTFDEFPKVCGTMADVENYVNDGADPAYEEKIFVYRAHKLNLTNVDGCIRINE